MLLFCHNKYIKFIGYKVHIIFAKALARRIALIFYNLYK